MTTTVSTGRRVDVGEVSVAYREIGTGPTVVLLHGGPFASFVWRDVMVCLADRFRCIAPDLLGLGDTETPDDADWSLMARARMVIGFLDRLGIERAYVVGHDHGGAVAQLLAARHPERVDRLVLSNAKAYDNWPSAEERPFIVATQAPVLGDIVLRMFARPRVLRSALARSRAGCHRCSSPR
jgi:pimeloyl-ACP methyl ester carboxylesterase